MTDQPSAGIHWSFWVIVIVALIWNGLGVANYLSQMNPDSLASLPEPYRAVIESRPAWATGGFAVAVFGGVVGCLLLLFKKAAAFYAFVLSLIGVVVQAIPIVTSLGELSDPTQIVVTTTMTLAVAAFLIWYSKLAEKKGWVR